MPARWLKYAFPFVMYVLAYFSFTQTGFYCWLPLIVTWLVVPAFELFLRPDAANLAAAEEELARKNRAYDLLLYTAVLLQFPFLYLFLHNLQHNSLSVTDIVARVLSMGLLCGMFGINVGHELGHRVNRFEQILAQAALLSSLYMHFFIEHNKGHHKRVATPEDPSSARYNEPVYLFYIRTIVFSYFSAWHIANAETHKKGKAVWTLHNAMIRQHLIQAGFIALVGFVFGGELLLYFVAAALTGILLLETVNYIEHYGLQRRMQASGQYERAMPHHSWNSDHMLGRLMLFELSRHSDHHYLASRKYQVLRHHNDAPQLPTGYPGSMLLALVPPAWFFVMNRRIRKLQKTPSAAV